MIGDDELRAFVESNPGQGSFEEYQYLRDRFAARAPCNLLIFGVGKDSHIWQATNAGGHTVFIEHEAEWIAKTREQVPGIEIHQVVYDTKRSQWKSLLERRDVLFMEDLANDLLSTHWDVIFVDSPQGGHDRRPGRMKSIYTASVLARRSSNVDVLLHDCDRRVEQVYGDRYFGPHLLVKQIRTLRHYRVRPDVQ
jgi:glucuronoxylan 4-O-methyltransferase